jgi:hypothetical protein
METLQVTLEDALRGMAVKHLRGQVPDGAGRARLVLMGLKCH